HRLADGNPHRSAHEPELEGHHDSGKAADLSVGDDDRIAAGAECRLSFLEPVGVTRAVAEVERVDDRLWQLDPRKGAVIEDELEALLSAYPQVVAAIAADVEIGFELAIKQHLLATRAFRPQILRHRLLGHDCADLRQDEIGEPIHRRLVTGWRWLVDHNLSRCFISTKLTKLSLWGSSHADRQYPRSQDSSVEIGRARREG